MSDQNTSRLPTWQEFRNEQRVKVLKDENFCKELISDPQTVVEMEMEMGNFKEGMK